MRMVSFIVKYINFWYILALAFKGSQQSATVWFASTKTVTSNTLNSTFALENVTFPTFVPNLIRHQTQVAVCGRRPPKTDERQHCETLHKERPNIARCPYPFPVTIFANIDQLKASYDVRELRIILRIDAAWSRSGLKVDVPKIKETYAWDNGSAASTNITTETEPSACAPSNSSWVPQLFIWSAQTMPSTGFMNNVDEFTVTEINGTFHLRSRLKLKLWCKTSLWQYPFDTHVCLLHIGVFQAQNYSVQPHWDSNLDAEHGDSRRYGGDEHEVAGFDVHTYTHSGSLVHAASLNNREILNLPVVIRLRRRRWRYVLYIYLPSCLLVIVGWASFFVPDELAEARVIIVFFNVLAALYLFQAMDGLPAAITLKAIDVWCLGVIIFLWLSVMTCFFDVKYAFRGIEGEQQEAIPDLIFFYQQPKLARRMADTAHQEDLERRRLSGRNMSLVDRMLTVAGLGGLGDKDDTDDAEFGAVMPKERRISRFDRRRHTSGDTESMYFDPWTADQQTVAVGSRIEWAEFYQWAHERHASNHPPEADGDDELQEGSTHSVQSLMQTMWSIRKQYLWFKYSDYISKCVETMYLVFFCLFVVVYCLIYLPDMMDEMQG